jgi:hypothetical protein
VQGPRPGNGEIAGFAIVSNRFQMVQGQMVPDGFFYITTFAWLSPLLGY